VSTAEDMIRIAMAMPDALRSDDAGISSTTTSWLINIFIKMQKRLICVGLYPLGANDVPMARKGILISVEGIDGTGKTTQVRLLMERLDKLGIDAVALKEPTQGRYGEEIARLASSGGLEDPRRELELFMLDRMEDVRENILPALEAGKVVIMDRYYQSNIAYQGARGLDPAKIKEENEKFSPVPDLIIILDVDPGIGMARVSSRRDVVGHFENEAYLRKVRELFLRIGESPNAVVIDASAPVEEVHRRIVEAIEKKLGGRLRQVYH